MPVGEQPELAGDAADIRMALGTMDQFLKPGRLDFGVVVEQDDIWSAAGGDGAVEGTCQPDVRVGAQNGCVWESDADDRRDRLGRAVVEDDQVEVPEC